MSSRSQPWLPRVRALEQALGQALFTGSGPHRILTDLGRCAYRYADEAVGLGLEPVDQMKGGSQGPR